MVSKEQRLRYLIGDAVLELASTESEVRFNMPVIADQVRDIRRALVDGLAAIDSKSNQSNQSERETRALATDFGSCEHGGYRGTCPHAHQESAK